MLSLFSLYSSSSCTLRIACSLLSNMALMSFLREDSSASFSSFSSFAAVKFFSVSSILCLNEPMSFSFSNNLFCNFSISSFLCAMISSRSLIISFIFSASFFKVMLSVFICSSLPLTLLICSCKYITFSSAFTLSSSFFLLSANNSSFLSRSFSSNTAIVDWSELSEAFPSSYWLSSFFIFPVKLIWFACISCTAKERH